MSGTTWTEYLQDVFQGIDSPDQINLDQFVLDLRARGISGLDKIEDSLAKLENEGAKKEVITLLWNLAHIDEKTPDEQRELYAKLARHYDKLFEWEDVAGAGLVHYPGSLFSITIHFGQ